MSVGYLISGLGFDEPCSQSSQCLASLMCIGGICTCPSTHYRVTQPDRCLDKSTKAEDKGKSSGSTFLSDERVWIAFLIICFILITSSAVAVLFVGQRRSKVITSPDNEGTAVEEPTSFYTATSAEESTAVSEAPVFSGTTQTSTRHTSF